MSHLPEPAKCTVSSSPSHSASESQVNERRQFIDRDRSTEPVIETDDTDGDETIVSPNYKELVGVKLPTFRGKYTDDVNAWISIIEDQLTLH